MITAGTDWAAVCVIGYMRRTYKISMISTRWVRRICLYGVFAAVDFAEYRLKGDARARYPDHQAFKRAIYRYNDKFSGYFTASISL